MSVPSIALGAGRQALQAPPRSRTPWQGIPQPEAQVPPVRVQCGSRRPHSAPRAVEKFVEIACRRTLEHGGDGTRSFRGEARQGLALPLFVLHARHRLLASGIVPEQPHGGFGEGLLTGGLITQAGISPARRHNEMYVFALPDQR